MEAKINQLDAVIPKWFAIYTKSKAEKKVANQLKEHNFVVYLPLKKEVRQWKDRLKKVDMPLFRSYVFVKITKSEYYKIPKLINGFVRFVTIGGNIIAVRDDEIKTIKRMLKHSRRYIEATSEDFKLYEEVKIKNGILKGLKGRLIRFHGRYQIALRINSLETSLVVRINKNAVSKTA